MKAEKIGKYSLIETTPIVSYLQNFVFIFLIFTKKIKLKYSTKGLFYQWNAYVRPSKT